MDPLTLWQVGRSVSKRRKNKPGARSRRPVASSMTSAEGDAFAAASSSWPGDQVTLHDADLTPLLALPAGFGRLIVAHGPVLDGPRAAAVAQLHHVLAGRLGTDAAVAVGHHMFTVTTTAVASLGELVGQAKMLGFTARAVTADRP